MSERPGDRPAGDRHDGVVQVGHQLGPPSPRDIRNLLGLHRRTEQLEHGLDSSGRFDKWRPHLQQRAGVLLDDARLEVGGADVQDAAHDAAPAENVGGFSVRPHAVLHRDDGRIRVQPGDVASRGLDVLRLDGQQNDVGSTVELRRRR